MALLGDGRSLEPVIFETIRQVRRRVEEAAARSGRAASDVEIVAVTKKAAPEAVARLLRAGCVRHVGENRVQDAALRARALGAVPGVPRPTWRMIGHLQTNKIGRALDVFDALDSLDSFRLAQDLEGRLERLGRELPVLLQVKLTGRAAQHGVAPEDVESFLERCGGFRRLRLGGLMAIAPMLEPPEAVRPYFRRMRELFDRSFGRGPGFVLSMGMSRDFEIAVEEGATMLRLGSVLFPEAASWSSAGTTQQEEATHDR